MNGGGKLTMNDKMFGLMEKMYSEMQNGFKELRGELKEGLQRLEKGQVKLENELKEAKDILFDGYKQNYEKLEVLENKVDKLATTIERHDIEIKVIRTAK